MTKPIRINNRDRPNLNHRPSERNLAYMIMETYAKQALANQEGWTDLKETDRCYITRDDGSSQIRACDHGNLGSIEVTLQVKSPTGKIYEGIFELDEKAHIEKALEKELEFYY